MYGNFLKDIANSFYRCDFFVRLGPVGTASGAGVWLEHVSSAPFAGARRQHPGFKYIYPKCIFIPSPVRRSELCLNLVRILHNASIEGV